METEQILLNYAKTKTARRSLCKEQTIESLNL